MSADIAALHAAGALLGKRPLRYSDMAVLVRKHNQAEKVQSVLRERGIRSVVQSDRSVFASDEARELQQFLQGVIDPRRDTLLKAALATTLIGFDAKRTFRARSGRPGTPGLARPLLGLEATMERRLLHRDVPASPRFPAGVRARLVHLPAGERRLTNFPASRGAPARSGKHHEPYAGRSLFMVTRAEGE